MQKRIKAKVVNPYKYDVLIEDNIIGKFIADVDGYFYWVTTKGDGTMSAWALREIADLLDRINKPWDDHITNYFNDEKNKESP